MNLCIAKIMFRTYTAFGFLHLRYRFNVKIRLTKSNVLHDLANWFYTIEKLFVVQEAEHRLFVSEKRERGKDSGLPMYKEVITTQHYD
jgi:hypothetical protein